MKGFVAFSVVSIGVADVELAKFDGTESNSSWKCQNDPVMGGASTSTFDATTGLFEGTCAVVGFLNAPGFSKIVGTKAFSDVTESDTFTLRVKSTTPAYQGFKLAFAAPGVPKTSQFGGASYKADFSLNEDSTDWQIVQVPFTQFSYDWSGYTGRCDTEDPSSFGRPAQQHYCCDKSGLSPSNSDVCVDSKYLSTINDLEVWAEGVAGNFSIQIDYIGATGLSTLESTAVVPIVSFGTLDATDRTWRQKNDPVMGGQSRGQFTVSDTYGTMEGTVALIPALQAPGFIKASAGGSFEDVSSCTGIELEVRSASDYSGYRFNFGNDKSSCGKFFARGYKADFTAPTGSFGSVQIPFNMFSNCWSDSTGDQIKTCAEDASVCPSAARLQDLQTISVWAEGVQGDVKIDVKKVGAYGCGSRLESTRAGNLVSFDSAKGTSFEFKVLNDPVMGGKSYGTWAVGSGFGILDGEVVSIPALSAPGFIKAAADGTFSDLSAFVDGSLVLSVRTSTPEFAGYRVTFVSGALSAAFACSGGGAIPFSRGCFKNKFSIPAGSDFVDIKIPFNTFSDKWSPATGEQTSTCAEDADVCPTASKLSKIKRVEFWAEGALGKVHLEVQSVSAENASGERLQLV